MLQNWGSRLRPLLWVGVVHVHGCVVLRHVLCALLIQPTVSKHLCFFSECRCEHYESRCVCGAPGRVPWGWRWVPSAAPHLHMDLWYWMCPRLPGGGEVLSLCSWVPLLSLLLRLSVFPLISWPFDVLSWDTFASVVTVCLSCWFVGVLNIIWIQILLWKYTDACISVSRLSFHSHWWTAALSSVRPVQLSFLYD